MQTSKIPMMAALIMPEWHNGRIRQLFGPDFYNFN
jgi:hypothetical protein